MESSRMTTSFLCSTKRLAFSITISATCTCRLAGSSKVEETNFALHRARHFRHFLGPLVDEQHDEVHLRVIGCDGGVAMFCSSMVLPAFGGETISPR